MSVPTAATPPVSPLALALALTLSATASPVRAQETPPSRQATTLDRIQVHGQRPPIATGDSLEQARERLDERAGGTAVLDAERYRDGRVSTLADALGFAPGVFVQPRFGAEEARIAIRGSGLQRTFHGRGLQVLQDGSPLNLADGSFDMQAIEPLAARYVEVYRGANALEYGAATLGGAIGFVAPTGYDAPAVQLRAEGGSFGYRRGQAAFAGSGDRADGYLSLTGLHADGYRAHARQENERLFGNAGWRFSDTLDGRIYLTHVDTRSELPGSLTLAQARHDPRMAAAGNRQLDQRRDFRLDRIGGKLAWVPGEGRTLTLSAYLADKALHHPIFQVLEQDSRDAGIDLRWRGEGRLGARRNVLTAGVAFAQGEIDDDRYRNVDGRRGERTNRYAQRAASAVFYLENQTWLDDSWAVSLGAQALRATRRSRDRFVDRGIDESFDRTYAGVSPKLGLRYLAADGVQLFANLSRSLEPPSFGELAGGPAATPVDKQRATTAEIGLRLRRDALSLDAAYYRARVDGELLSLNDAEGNPLGTRNAGRTRHQGLELGADWDFARDWRLSANYLWNDFRFDGDPVYGRNRLAGIPPHLLRAALRWSPGPRWHVTPGLEWAPQDYDVDHANSFKAPGYAILGLRIGGEAGPQWSWFADARNLTDRKWIATTGVIADARGRDTANFLPGEGRALYVGMEWRMR
ncbi:TonB-dependent receptor family protein [Luteimonas aquatica]|uniref:TonB-dependent receptor family protein n=1 Tax=Luteimonas aquatica TaxID=450364 RepID=UPI001F578EA4|nr:TonB-dependent receptor [Luteimonas aquatica]